MSNSWKSHELCQSQRMFTASNMIVVLRVVNTLALLKCWKIDRENLNRRHTMARCTTQIPVRNYYLETANSNKIEEITNKIYSQVVYKWIKKKRNWDSCRIYCTKRVVRCSVGHIRLPAFISSFRQPTHKNYSNDHSTTVSTAIDNDADDDDCIGNGGKIFRFAKNLTGNMGRISFSGYKLFIFIRIPVCRCYCFRFAHKGPFIVWLFFFVFCLCVILFLSGRSFWCITSLDLLCYGKIREKN